MSPHPHQPPMPPMAGRLGERQGSRIKGLRPQKQKVGANVFTEHSGEYILIVIRQARGWYFANIISSSYQFIQKSRNLPHKDMNYYAQFHTTQSTLHHLKPGMVIDYEGSSFPLGRGVSVDNIRKRKAECVYMYGLQKWLRSRASVHNIVYGVNVTQLYFGRGEILCILNLTFIPRFISLNLFYSTHKDNSAWSFVCRICGYVVFSPLFSCLSKPGTVQIRQFPLTYQILNFVTQIKNHHLGISPKVDIVHCAGMAAGMLDNPHYIICMVCWVGSLFSPLTMT